jgi:hypothetical protein
VATIQAICDALETRLDTLKVAEPRLTIHSEPSNDVFPPAIVIDSPDTATPTNLCQTAFTETFSLFVVVDYSDIVQAHLLLRELMSVSGSKSVRAALLADPTLGGVVHGLEVLDRVQVGEFNIEEMDWFGYIQPLEIDH